MKLVASCPRCGAVETGVVGTGDLIRVEHDCPRRAETPTAVALRKLTGSKPVARIRLKFERRRATY